jgi:hypothetical protein
MRTDGRRSLEGSWSLGSQLGKCGANKDGGSMIGGELRSRCTNLEAHRIWKEAWTAPKIWALASDWIL